MRSVTRENGQQTPANTTPDVQLQTDGKGASGTNIARSHPGEDQESEENLSVSAKVGGTDHWLRAKASGPFAVVFLVVCGLVAVLVLLDPQRDPKHFILTFLAVFAAGMTLHMVIVKSHVQNLIREKEQYRTELNRVTAAKRRLEEKVLENRLSSDRPPPSTTKSDKKDKGSGK